MENLVPLGTGNSRLMKSNIPASTTLAQLIHMWNNGTFPYDIGPLNSAGISQQGTPLNKDTLLKDSTAALYGLTNTAVPDDVLNVLSRFQSGLGNEYLWEKSILEYSVNLSSKSEGSNWIFSYNSPPESIIVEYSSEVYGNSDQKILLKSPNSIEVTASTSVSILQSLLRGKFVYQDTNGTRLSPIKIGEDAVLSMPNGLNNLMITTWYTTSIGDEQSVFSGYVNSPSSDTYPPEVPDGYTYTALGQLGARVQIATGSYVGTGTYGASNPNTLTFEFEPKVFIFFGATDSNGTGVRAYDCSIVPFDYLTETYKAVYLDDGANTSSRCNMMKYSNHVLSWYYNDPNYGGASYQNNASGLTYYYAAIG